MYINCAQMTRLKVVLPVRNDDESTSALQLHQLLLLRWFICFISVLSAIFSSLFFCFFFIIICNVPRNPTPGMLINRPNGSDVYRGVPKDYTGDVSFGAVHKHSKQIFRPNLWLLPGCFRQSVTPKNFLAVLRGDSARAEGKVIQRWVDRVQPSGNPSPWVQEEVWDTFALFVSTAAPTITCLCTSLTTVRLVFWHFPTTM